MAHQEFPKWMHHAEQGSRIFDKQEDIDAAGSGWSDTQEQAAADEAGRAQSVRAAGVSDAQHIANLEAELATARQRLTAMNAPPGNAAPATSLPNAIETNTVGHNAIEFATASGARELVADVDTRDRDQVMGTLRAMGVDFDETAGLVSLRNKLKARLRDNPAQFAQSNPRDLEA